MDPVPRHKSVGIRKTSRTKLTNEERALPFIKVTQTDSSDKSIFQVTDEARHFLSELTGPLAVVTVTGLYRTGKSYLINRMLLNRKQGFGVGNSINACTKVSHQTVLLCLFDLGNLDLVKTSARLHC